MPILLNDRHKVSEAPSSCVALVSGGTIATPSLTSDILPGVTRATVVELAAELGIPVAEREVDRTELYMAEELFLMGTGAEILPVVVVDGLPVGTAPPTRSRGSCGRPTPPWSGEPRSAEP